MYAPKQFCEERPEILVDAMRAIQFGALVVAPDGLPSATHLPMIVRHGDDAITLESHVATGNPLWKTAVQGVEALAIFQGPQAYVHPGWYETKRATGKAVPTWNYVAVHARGTLAIERDREWLRAHVVALTERNEAGRAEPWAVSDAPEDYVDAMLGAIVGLRLAVTSVEGVWKMIQHHPQANRLGTIAGLRGEPDGGAHAVAAVMAAHEHRRG